ncbi:MAG: acetate kinase [Candidatus Gracilibacteria bacterium]
MKKILVINCGSSSLKFELFQSGKELKSIAEGLIDRIGKPDCRFTFKSGKKHLGIGVKVKNHTEAIALTLDSLKKANTIKSNKEIDLVGHRVVHGGAKYTTAVKIDASVLKTIRLFCPLAPLHNPINLKGIETCKKLLPKAKQVAVFDTAFHQTMEEKAYLYAIPSDLHEKHGIRRYGFHGTSHKYVTEKVIKLLGSRADGHAGYAGPKIITVHLGNGSSITASLNGKVVDTSLGFTPLEGLPMGTRCGSIDPAIPLKIQEIKKWNYKKTSEFLNNECGLKALSRISSDMREIYAASLKKDKNAILAIEHLSYNIAKYIGAYASSLNGLDAIAFTAGIGEKAFYVREEVCSYLSHLGVELDKSKNVKNEQLISGKKSKVKVFVIPTNEELEIAQESLKIK